METEVKNAVAMENENQECWGSTCLL